MFRKLVSNLPYSPALITEVGFYAKRLRKEEVTRRMTVLFVALTLLMQSLSLLSPPESANASSEQDVIRGGVSDLSDFLTRYDHNEDDIKDIYTTVGVSRSEIAAVHSATITTSNDAYFMTRYGQLGAADHEIALAYQRSAGGTGIRYFSPLSEVANPYQTFKGWVGTSATLGWFGIMQANGSLVTHGIPTSFSPASDGTNASTRIVSAEDLTQNRPAETTKVEPTDKISYTLQASNNHSTTVTADFSVRIADILEYATLIDAGGGSIDSSSSTLSWPNVQLAPGQSQQRTFVVQILDTIPSTGVGQSNPESYDCKLTVSFGSVLSVPVDCPLVKSVEAAFFQMPSVGIGGNLIFSSIVLFVVAFFALRSRQLKKEIRIIRHNFNTGII